MKRSILISCIFLCFSNHAASDAVKLAPMTIYGDRLRAELIEPTRMQTELDREKLQAAEMPDLNNTLKSQPCRSG